MANYINGSHLCVYHGPLTLKMFQRMHATKNTKEAHQQMIDDVQVEAKEWVQKLHQKKLYINNVQTSSKLQLPMPILTVAVESQHYFHEALLDSSADANILTISIYNHLCNKAKLESQDHLYNFQK